MRPADPFGPASLFGRAALRSPWGARGRVEALLAVQYQQAARV